jgi:hypothetical protein
MSCAPRLRASSQTLSQQVPQEVAFGEGIHEDRDLIGSLSFSFEYRVVFWRIMAIPRCR